MMRMKNGGFIQPILHNLTIIRLAVLSNNSLQVSRNSFSLIPKLNIN
jgi:hypothetical protein